MEQVANPSPRELLQPRGQIAFSDLGLSRAATGGFGVHATLDMTGKVKFGPDVEWVSMIDYAVDPTRAARFYRSIRRYWPRIKEGSLQPDYAGIRPKIGARGAADADFMVQG